MGTEQEEINTAGQTKQESYFDRRIEIPLPGFFFFFFD